MARTATRKSAKKQPQMEMPMAAPAAAPVPSTPAPAPPAAPRESISAALKKVVAQHNSEPDRSPFGSWLLRQPTGRSEALDMLIKGAKHDPRFPKSGDPDAVRAHVGKQGADPDLFEAIDDAELMWLA